MAKFRGVNPRFTIIDEATAEFSGMHPSQQAEQRGWGDDWDDTAGGVILRPIPKGTLVEFYDRMRDQVMLGKVIKRDRSVRVNGSTSYDIETPSGRFTIGRESVALFDRSPEGIEAFLEGNRDAEKMTPEELERWLDA